MFLIESRSSKRLTLFHVNASLKTNYVPSVCDGGLYSVISLPGNSDGHVLVHWNGPQFCPAVLARVFFFFFFFFFFLIFDVPNRVSLI